MASVEKDRENPENKKELGRSEILRMSLAGASYKQINAFLSGCEKTGVRKIYYRDNFLKKPKANDINYIRFKKFIDKGGWFLTPFDREYPDLLRELADIPPIIYGFGKKEFLNSPCLSIIGTRNPSSYGVDMAEKFSFSLAQRGLTIVSGLAYGIDSLAHRGALKAGGSTIAVLGSGVDNIYPQSHFFLAEDIKKSGCLISEYIPGTGPKKHHFIERNRIIATLSKAILLVEAKIKSGSFITIKVGLEQGREIFCIPGNLDQIRSMGTNSLIRQGAALVMDPSDIMSTFPSYEIEEIKELKSPCLTDDEARVYDKLSVGAVSADSLSLELKMDIARIYTLLTGLEWKGKVRALDGGLYIKEE